jgi:hypothetical protein
MLYLGFRDLFTRFPEKSPPDIARKFLRPYQMDRPGDVYQMNETRTEANRRNAAQSTGPRTPEGKARSSRNATRHGLCARTALLSTEDRQEFDLLLEDLRAEHQPDGSTEDILVFKMAEAFFMSQRANFLLTSQLNEQKEGKDNSKHVALMLRYFTSADRAFGRHLNDLRKLKKERRLEEVGFVSQNASANLVLDVAEPTVEPVDPPKTEEIEVELPQTNDSPGLPPLDKAA